MCRWRKSPWTKEWYPWLEEMLSRRRNSSALQGAAQKWCRPTPRPFSLQLRLIQRLGLISLRSEHLLCPSGRKEAPARWVAVFLGAVPPLQGHPAWWGIPGEALEVCRSWDCREGWGENPMSRKAPVLAVSSPGQEDMVGAGRQQTESLLIPCCQTLQRAGLSA